MFSTKETLIPMCQGSDLIEKNSSNSFKYKQKKRKKKKTKYFSIQKSENPMSLPKTQMQKLTTNRFHSHWPWNSPERFQAEENYQKCWCFLLYDKGKTCFILCSHFYFGIVFSRLKIFQNLWEISSISQLAL